METHRTQPSCSLKEHRLLGFGAEVPEAQAAKKETTEQPQQPNPEMAAKAKARSQNVQEHMRQESKERELYERAQNTVESVRAKVEQGRAVTAEDLRPLHDVLMDVREQFDGQKAVVDVERVLGSVGGGVEMNGPNGTKFRLLAHNDAPGGPRFMLVREVNGVGTQVARDDGERPQQAPEAERRGNERSEILRNYYTKLRPYVLQIRERWNTLPPTDVQSFNQLKEQYAKEVLAPVSPFEDSEAQRGQITQSAERILTDLRSMAERVATKKE